MKIDSGKDNIVTLHLTSFTDTSFVDFLCWVKDIGEYAIIISQFDDPEAMIVHSKVATEMAIKNIRNAFPGFDTILLVIVAIEYRANILILFQQSGKIRAVPCICCKANGINMQENENIPEIFIPG